MDMSVDSLHAGGIRRIRQACANCRCVLDGNQAPIGPKLLDNPYLKNIPGAKRPSAQGSAQSAFIVAAIAWLVSMSHILRPSTMAFGQPLCPPWPTISIMLVDAQDMFDQKTDV